MNFVRGPYKKKITSDFLARLGSIFESTGTYKSYRNVCYHGEGFLWGFLERVVA